MNLKTIRRRLASRAAKCERLALTTRYVERRRWLEGRAHGMRLAISLLDRRECSLDAARSG